jgi:hypothetical protein
MFYWAGYWEKVKSQPGDNKIAYGLIFQQWIIVSAFWPQSMLMSGDNQFSTQLFKQNYNIMSICLAVIVQYRSTMLKKLGIGNCSKIFWFEE